MPIPVIKNNEILLFGTVGLCPHEEGEYLTSAELAQVLARMGSNTDVTVRINSCGGLASEGLACYWMLKSHHGKVTVVVEGIAASAGSVIAMAGDTVRIAPSALVMIHDASIATAGTVEQLSKSIEALNRQSEAYAAAYAEKSGKSVSAMRDLMKAETWFTAEEAIAAGLADELDAANDNPEPAAFAYGSYARAPQRIVALADARGWNARSIDRAGVPAPDKEPSMTGQKPTGAPPVDQRARMKAILTADVAKGRQTLAEYLAFDTDDPPEKALAILAAAPAAAAEPADTSESYAARRVAASAHPNAGLARPGVRPNAARRPLPWSDAIRHEER